MTRPGQAAPPAGPRRPPGRRLRAARRRRAPQARAAGAAPGRDGEGGPGRGAPLRPDQHPLRDGDPRLVGGLRRPRLLPLRAGPARGSRHPLRRPRRDPGRRTPTSTCAKAARGTSSRAGGTWRRPPGGGRPSSARSSASLACPASAWGSIAWTSSGSTRWGPSRSGWPTPGCRSSARAPSRRRTSWSWSGRPARWPTSGSAPSGTRSARA